MIECLHDERCSDCPYAKIANQIVERLAQAMRADIVAKFSVGDEIHSMRTTRGGQQAIRGLARHLALDEGRILRMARVSERFTRKERDALLSIVDGRGLPLTWSHLEELQRVRSARLRSDLAREALRDHLSVRELRGRVRATVAESIASR